MASVTFLFERPSYFNIWLISTAFQMKHRNLIFRYRRAVSLILHDIKNFNKIAN
ncbi:hypothetical protein PGB90_004496 [Kerria lacca]